MFEKTNEVYLGQEYGVHTFQFLCQRNYKSTSCIVILPQCKTPGHILKSLNLFKMQSMASVNCSPYSWPHPNNSNATYTIIYCLIQIKTRIFLFRWRNFKITFWNYNICWYYHSPASHASFEQEQRKTCKSHGPSGSTFIILYQYSRQKIFQRSSCSEKESSGCCYDFSISSCINGCPGSWILIMSNVPTQLEKELENIKLGIHDLVR